jgi:zinc D-Ala-D-Ala carboxypeptidase
MTTNNETDIHRLLSDHFTLYELVRSVRAELLELDNMPDEKQIKNLGSLCRHILEPSRIALGDSIHITSGYRSRELNRIVGGVRNSKHLRGLAADIHIKSEEYGRRLFDILKMNTHVDQLLFEHGKNGGVWIHVSYSPKPRHLINGNYIPQ